MARQEMMQQVQPNIAPQKVLFAKAVPISGANPAQAVVAKPMPVQGQVLQEAPAEAAPAEAAPAEAAPAEAAPAEAPAEEPAPAAAPEGGAEEGEAAGAEMGQAEAGAEAEVQEDATGALQVPAGAGPGANAGGPAPAPCTAPCPNEACVSYFTSGPGYGCYASHGTPPMVKWECECPPPPPPPIVGSQEWMHSDGHNFEDPGPEAGQASLQLGMYEAGEIAVNYNDYLKASADRTRTQAKIEDLIYKDLSAVSGDQGVEENAKEGEAEGKDEAESGVNILGVHVPFTR